jgi:hypothetical protein
MRVRNAFFAAGSLALIFVLARCGSKGNGFDNDGGSDNEGGMDLDADLTQGDGTMQGMCGPNDPISCSGDLHSVLCGSTVKTTCPPDQGCANGTCIPACDAAVANKSTVGCEYYAHNPIMIFGNGCFAMFVANTWNAPIKISGDAGGKTIDLTKYAYLPQGTGANLTFNPVGGQVQPGKVAIVFLRDNGGGMAGTKCPKPAAETDPNASGWTDPKPGTNLGAIALRVTTTAPVVAYDALPFGGGKSEVTDATLMLPTSTWDKNYIVVTPRPTGNNTLSPAFAIVAASDGTKVTIRPTVDITAGGGVPMMTTNQPTTVMMNKAQVLRVEQMTDTLGSIVSTDKPVGLWGEQSCINIDAYACDGAHEQIPPVRALGNEYAVVRYRDRMPNANETPPVRIVGAVDGTTLTYEPMTPTGAPSTIAEGQAVDVRAIGGAPFIVRSQDDKHPFYVAQYMTGGGAFMNGRGDPEFVNTIPTAQFLNRYLFFTDPTYPETNLVLVRKKHTDGTFKDVKLECGPVISGWAPVGNGGQYEFVRWDIASGNFMGKNGCDNGAHEASSGGLFGLTIWAWGTEVTGMPGSPGYSGWVSYAYPAGASVQSINTVVIPPDPK